MFDEDEGYSFTLTFTLNFPHDNDTVYLAHCYPYTYRQVTCSITNADKCNYIFLEKRLLDSTRIVFLKCSKFLLKKFSKGGQWTLLKRSLVAQSNQCPPYGYFLDFIQTILCDLLSQ